MPLIIRLPRNETVAGRLVGYRSHLNVLDRKETAVQRELRRGGLAAYEPFAQAAILTMCEQISGRIVFYDVGAHIGLYSAMVAAVFEAAQPLCYAFEPTPETAAIGRKVASRNGLRYEVVEKAISDERGSVSFFVSPKAETSNSLAQGFRPGARQVTVEAITLDDFVATAVPPAVVKIDVETFEPQVLDGARTTFARHRPWVICELLRKTDRGRAIGALSFLESLDYKLYRIGARTPYEAKDIQALLDGGAGMTRNCILAPSDLGESFYRSHARWLQAIAECGPETNVLVPKGEKPPERIALYYGSEPGRV